MIQDTDTDTDTGYRIPDTGFQSPKGYDGYLSKWQEWKWQNNRER